MPSSRLLRERQEEAVEREPAVAPDADVEDEAVPGDPGAVRPPGVLRLQRLVGNANVSRAILQRVCMLEVPPAPQVETGGGGAPLTVPAAGGGAETGAPAAPAQEEPALAAAPEPQAEPAPEFEADPAAAAQPPPPTGATEAPKATTKKTIRMGSTGAEVREAQTKLNAATASDPLLAVDGIFGPKTRGATKAFQTSHGLVPDAIIGPLTWAALDTPAPKPPDKDDERKKALDQVEIKVVEHGSSDAAVKVAKKIQDEEWRNLDTPALKQIAGLTVELHVIPHDKKMTDLDEFKALKGTKTFDGRLWDDVRGINMGKVGKKIISAVAEETLVEIKGKPPGYALGFVAAHESGHAIRSAFTPDQDKELVRLYNQRIKDKGQPKQPKSGDPPEDKTLDDWLSPRWYSASNADEYLAQSVSAFFGHPYSDDKDIAAKYTRDWLKTHDNGMYKFLAENVYAKGTP